MLARFSMSTLPAAGALALATLLSGCSSGSSGGFSTTTTTGASGASLTAGGASTVYALNDVSTTSATAVNNTLEFPAASTGSSIVPAVTIPLNTLAPTGAAVDGTGSLYVAGVDDTTGIPSVSVYAAGAASGAVPVRTFLTNPVFEPISLAVSAAGQAYVLEGEYDTSGDLLAAEIEVFAPGAASGAAATSVITGSTTQLIDPQDIAVDAAGNIYVANYQDDNVSQILVFAAGASGSVAPARAVTFNGEITGIAVDSSANMYVAAVSTTGAASIVEYPAGSSGTPAAVKTISGTASGLNAASTGSVRVDAAGNIWLIQQTAVTSAFSTTYFEAWPSTANGNVAPAVQFAPPSLLNPNGAFAIR